MKTKRLMLWIGFTVLIASCRNLEAKPERTGVVDSMVPRDDALARFQASIPQVGSLTGGAPSRDQLVSRFVTALEKRDTLALGALVLTQSEFGWLYYPTNPEGLPPYNLTPQLMWFTLDGNSAKGYQRLLQLRSGKSLRLISHRCQGEPGRQGENTVWGPCLVLRHGEKGDTISERLFGQIVERGGRYKFVSYANKL
jgi:hypothetical protein